MHVHRFYSNSSESNNEQMNQFGDFLDSLSTDKQTLDNLRLPLQVASFISPLFLLGEMQFHTSAFCVQRYKLALVCQIIYTSKCDIIYLLNSIQNVWVMTNLKSLLTLKK